MKRFITWMLTLVLLVCSLPAALADTAFTSMTIVGATAYESRAELRVRLRMGSNSTGAVPDAADMTFVVNGQKLPVKGEPQSEPGTRYVFVVDCGQYYSTHIDFAAVKSLMNSAISAMGAQDECAFVRVTNEAGEVTSFMDRQSAQGYVGTLTQSKTAETQTRLFDGVGKAVAALGNSVGDKQGVIVVIATGSNGGGLSLADAQSRIRNLGAPIYRVALYRMPNDASASHREKVNGYVENLQSLTASTDDKFRQLNFEDKAAAGSDAVSIGMDIADYGKSIVEVSLDVTEVSLMQGNSFTLEAYCQSGGRTLSDTSTVELHASQIPTPTPAPTDTPAPSTEPIKYNKDSDSGDLEYIQQLLKALYYYDGEPNGIYDGAMKSAVMNFYEQNHLTVYENGVSEEAYELMKRGVEGGAVPMPTATPDPNRKFAMGDTNPEVPDAQKRLLTLGYYYQAGITDEKDARTGVFDQNMQLAVYEFCTANNLAKSEGMSVAAFDLLMSAAAKNVSTPAPTAAPTDTPVPTADPDVMIAKGQEDSQVIEVQERLTELYYYTEGSGAYGVMDEALLKAVNDFCTDNRLPRNNYMSRDAYELLMNGSPAPKATEQPVELYIPLAKGDSNDYVTRYQQRLIQLKYLDKDETTLGTYDDATQRAQDKLCEVNAIPKESGASVSLQMQVDGEGIQESDDPGLTERVRKFLLRPTDIVGMKLPMWVLVLVCTVLTAAVIVLIVLLVKPKAKKQEKPAATVPGGMTGIELEASEKETEAIGGDGLMSMDPPTSVGMDDWYLTLMITYAGISQDASYTMKESVPLIIGRGSDADIHLNKDDLSVSRHHGELTYMNGVLHYKDTSRMGTYVNGQVVFHNECDLAPGTELIIGKSQIKIGTR